MTDPALFHTWDGLTFGVDPEAEEITYELVESPGLEDFATSGGSIDGSGSEGSGISPLMVDDGSWSTVVEIYGSTFDEWKARRDALRAATSPLRWKTSEGEYVIHAGTDVRTIFARPDRRTIPQDERYYVNHFGETQIGFMANDPLTYGPTTTTNLDAGDGTTYTAPGSEFSQRWRWIVHGPAHNPRLTLSVEGEADQIIRFVGDVNDGQNLLVESTPHGLVTTVGGFNRYGDFDGGNTNIRPDFFHLPPGEQTVTYTAGMGAGDGSFRWRTAYL